MSNIIASELLANGLRTEFADTYEKVRITQADSRLDMVMDLGLGADNREHDFGYMEAAPHMDLWNRGDPIPVDGMDSVSFNVPIYEWGRRVKWLKWDRKDERTGTLVQMARQAGTSAALLPERMFFDLLNNGTATLPATVTAPDGKPFFSITDGKGGQRFGVTGGNQITVAGFTADDIITDFYLAIARFKGMQDGQGQPLFGDEVMEQGFVIIHPVEITEAMETAFLQKRQVSATVAGGGGSGSQTNLVQDTSKNVTLWGSSRLSDDNDWYVFLKNPPKKATFWLNRQDVMEFTSLEGDNNSDLNRSTAEEYIQWESRSGAGIALPYAAIEITQ